MNMNVVFFFFLTLVNLVIFHGKSEVIYEEGYRVKTVFDGNKHKINPHSVAPLYNSHHVLLLDSSNSLFYTLSLPLSQESVAKKFSGNGKPQYSDGDSSSATFAKPKSFTVDFKGNVYVADGSNHAIRKISPSGVTTIAGGERTGRDDGPGRNASFSTNYEISFVPDICALLIADKGNQLIRQINLKQEDCVSSQIGGLGSSKLLVSGIAVFCLIVGLIAGFAMRPYITRTEELKLLNKSWTSYLMNLERQARMHCFGTRNAIASPALQFLREIIVLCFAHLSLMFSFLWINRVDSRSSSVCKEYVSLLDSDNSSNSEHLIMSQKYAEQMKELTCNGDLGLSEVSNAILKREDFLERDGHCQCDGQIDNLILTNMQSFNANAGKSTGLEDNFLGVSTVVKRR